MQNFAVSHSRIRQRGFNLVEIGIILAVLGLIIGASLVPLGQIWRSNAVHGEQAALRAHQDAILGYALAHSTIEREVTVTGPSGVRTYTIPAGRPYLPCPDADGDGYEDRGGVPAPGEAIIDTDYNIDSSANDLLTEGNCKLSRGALPWKTLGVKGADRWGNRYTYQVDDVFSSAVIGFNQDTVPDSFDQRLPVRVAAGGRLLYQKRDDSVEVDGFANKRRPIVICSGDSVPLCQNYSGADLVLKGGSVADGDYTAGRRDYSERDVIEGAVYAIVSHGENGYGAVNHAANKTAGEVRCNFPANSASSSAGEVNVAEGLNHEAANFPFSEQTLPNSARYCSSVRSVSPSAVSFQNGFFVSHPPASDFDDVLTWTMRRELLQELARAEKLPVDEAPLFRAY